MVMTSIAVMASAEIRVSKWKEVNSRDGIVGYTRMTSLTGLEEVKAVGAVDAPVAVIEAVLRDVEAAPQYMYKCAEAKEVNLPGLTKTDDIGYVYNRTSMPWPVDDRYVVVRSQLMVDAKTETLYVRSHEVTENFPQAPSGAVKMPLIRYIMIVTPLESRNQRYTYRSCQIPGEASRHLW
ncbi:MAG: hypothetical protein MZV70_54965 [Desulfobacterales bacterium]|nr:hypothetical protein [Desulfobacterales bacterium]